MSDTTLVTVTTEQFNEFAVSLNVENPTATSLQEAFDALEDDDARHALCQEVLGSEDYSVQTEDFATFFENLEVSEDEDEENNDSHGEDGTTGNNIAFKSGKYNVVRELAFKANPAPSVTRDVEIVNAWKTERVLGKTGSKNRAGKDLLHGKKNYMVILEALDEDRKKFEIPTNLRFIQGVKGARLFGASHTEGVNRFLPKSLFSDIAFDTNGAQFACSMKGLDIDSKKGHTYVSTLPSAVASAKKAIEEGRVEDSCLVEVENPKKANEMITGVLLKYTNTDSFRFQTFGSKLQGTALNVFLENLEISRKRDEKLNLEKKTELEAIILEEDHREKNSAIYEKRETRETTAQLKKYNFLVSKGMDEDRASKIAFGA
jgi:hypothetical protein